ncbi:MAG: YkgJ family cysteine cluster protein [Kiritimatiellia bacterium]
MPNKENSFDHPPETVPAACARCGACCRYAGEVRLQADEVETIARFLNMPVCDFTAAFTSLRPDRSGLILNESEDGACIFLKENLCRIQSAKPRQCRDFPFRWQIPGFESICRAQRLVTSTHSVQIVP